MLEHSPADITAMLLQEAGVAATVYVRAEPNAPDAVVTVFDTAGRKQGRTQPTGDTEFMEGVQVRVRDADGVRGFKKASEIRAALEAVQRIPVAVGGADYCVNAYALVGSILSLGPESPSSRREVFTLNALVSLRRL